jgi:hypothetical protein
MYSDVIWVRDLELLGCKLSQRRGWRREGVEEEVHASLAGDGAKG